MADYIASDSEFATVADAIRTKGGTSASLEWPNGFASAIAAIPSGGGTPNLQAKTNVAPTESSQTITPDSGYDGLESVQINAVSSSYVGSGITRRSTSDMYIQDGMVIAPVGYYSVSGKYVIPSGTAGTPTATKGTVSNHSVTVTPSVTNTAGYINGGTKTGTGVSVSASELVSGNKEITANGTNIDVSTFSTVSVAVPTGGGGGMNVQAYHGTDYTQTTSYTETDVSLTVSVSGTYKISWSGVRSTTSGTSGSQLYINGTAHGSAQTSFNMSSYAQCINLTGVSLTKNDVLVVRARARNTSSYMYVCNLVIEQTA